MKDGPNQVVPNPTARVNPSEASLAELAASDVAAPIAMLNLLRYDGTEGRNSYGRYAQSAAGSIAAVGGSLLYLGHVIESDSWDSVALVYYPSAHAYLAMQGDPQYVEAIPDRTAGLRARLLCPFELPHVNGRDASALMRCRGSEIMGAQLVRWQNQPAKLGSSRNSGSTNSTAALRLRSVGSGLVTDGRWDELRLLRYTSQESRLAGPTLVRRSDPDIADLAIVLSQPVDQT